MLMSYNIHVEGLLDPGWSDWLEGMEITHLENGQTQLSGPLADQAALYGLLNRIRDMNLILVSVVRKVPPHPAPPAVAGEEPKVPLGDREI